MVISYRVTLVKFKENSIYFIELMNSSTNFLTDS